jgi:hypothetical protein
MRTLPGLKKYGYCGPNTSLQKRLDDININPKPGYEPINKVDEVCVRHDINYINGKNPGFLQPTGENTSRAHGGTCPYCAACVPGLT